MPQVGDVVAVDGLELKVVALDGLAVGRMRMSRRPDGDAEDRRHAHEQGHEAGR